MRVRQTMTEIAGMVVLGMALSSCSQQLSTREKGTLGGVG